MRYFWEYFFLSQKVSESEKNQALTEVSIKTAERKLEAEIEETRKLNSEVTQYLYTL